MAEKTPDEKRQEWVLWLFDYGPGKFYDAFVRTAQYARGLCEHCGESIYLDVVEGGGVPDWRDESGSYGCPDSPDNSDEGTGAHVPEKLDEDKE